MNYSKPRHDELVAALGAADAMREQGADPHHIAKVLRYLHERCQVLEALVSETDRYLRFGLPAKELSKMRLLVDELREDAAVCGTASHRDSAIQL